MKKFASLALALTLTGAAAFADPALTVSAYVDSGVKAEITEGGYTLQNYASDWDAAGVRAKLGAAYAGEKAGFNVTAALTSEGAVTTDTAYGWVSPFEGFKLFAGTSYSGVFDGVDDKSADYFSSKGVSAVYSISGLTLGAGIVPAVIANQSADGVFGAAYALEKLASLRFSAFSLGEKLNNASISASLSAVENLSLSAGFVSEGIASTPTQSVDGSVGYQITTAFSAGVTGYDYVTAEYFGITPNATYKVTDAATVYGEVAVSTLGEGNYVPKLKVTYTVAPASTIWGYVKYDVKGKTTTVAVDYLYSF